jgi:hypothetical protein
LATPVINSFLAPPTPVNASGANCLIFCNVAIVCWAVLASVDVVFQSSLAILAFDLLTFLLDLVMVLRRWKFVIALRYIMCSVSLSLSVVLSVNFYLFSE